MEKEILPPGQDQYMYTTILNMSSACNASRAEIGKSTSTVMVSGIPKFWNPKGFFRVLFRLFLNPVFAEGAELFHLFSAKISSSSLCHQDKTCISTLRTKPWNLGLALVWFLGSLECFERRDTKLFISAGWAMIFHTITLLTYAVLLNTESLSLPEKQHGPIQTMTLSQLAGQQLQSHKHILPQECTITFCQQLPHDASCTHRGPGIGSV